MQAKLDVVSQADYDKMVAEKSAAAVKSYEEKHPKTASAPAAAPAPVVASVQP